MKSADGARRGGRIERGSFKLKFEIRRKEDNRCGVIGRV